MSQAEGVLPDIAIEPTFRDPAVQAGFERDGVIVAPVFDADEVAELRRAVLDILPPPPWDFFDLLRNNPPPLRRRIDALVRDAVVPKIADWFTDHRFWAASILAKPPGHGGIVPLHTDWTFVDESRYRSGLAWVALEDMTLHNGAMHVSPGTNRLDADYSGHQIHYPYDDPEVRQLIDGRRVTLEIPAGQAVVWDNRVLHGSDENVTDDLRLAVAVTFSPREAQLYHYRLMPDGRSHRYRVDPEFFSEYEPFSELHELTGPHLSHDGVHPLPTWTPTPDDLRALGPVQPIHGAPRVEDSQPRRRRRFWRR